MNHAISYAVIPLAVVVVIGTAVSVAAAAGPGFGGSRGGTHGMPSIANAKPAAIGTVTAVSGTTITVSAKGRGGEGAETTYTVDASNATVLKKNGTGSAVSAIVVGDTVVIQGAISGTSITAKMIRDGGPPQKPRNKESDNAQAPPIQGNGKPVIGGSVTAINSATLTVTNKSNVTYTVDASSATVVKGRASSTLAGVAIGDNVLIQGTVNGNLVTASSIIIDQGVLPATGNATSTAAAHGGRTGGFFGSIGKFFQQLFGFF